MNLKSLIPVQVKKPLRALHRAHVLSAALRKLDRKLSGSGEIPSRLIADLIYGWGNEGWSAKPELMSYVLEEFRNFRGTALECGSGISTILLSLVARRTGATLFSLEHDPDWFQLVRARSLKAGLPITGLLHCPLKTFGTYTWYDTDDRLPRDAGLDFVLCDGPPEITPGGRYGLMPRIEGRLNSGAQLILDDSNRESEGRILRQWLDEYPDRLVTSRVFPTFTVLEMR